MSDKPNIIERLPKSYIAGWIAAVVLTFGPLFIQANRDQYLVMLPGIVSIIILVIIDQYNGADQRSRLSTQLLHEFGKLSQDVLTECQRAITGAQVVSVFSLLDAHKYVEANAIRAKKIYNTRLGKKTSEEGDSGYMFLRNLQDNGFISAVQNGSSYNLIFDRAHEESVNEFRKKINGLRSSTTGIVQVYPVDTNGAPILQFILLEFENGHKECLVGYGLGDDITTTPDIILVRSAALYDYLHRVHEALIRMLSQKSH